MQGQLETFQNKNFADDWDILAITLNL
jgi:hypothetical protein